MPSFLELFAPRWTEMQRARARQQFQAGLQQPELFQTEQYPIPEMAQSYEKGYGMPYPTQQAPSPTQQIEGMTTDPNRGTTIEPPENMPVEYVQPRSLEESTLRQAGIQGQGLAEKDIAAGEYTARQSGRFAGMFEDYGEDPEDFELDQIGPYKRKQSADNDPLVQIPGFGMLPASVGYHYLQDPEDTDKADIMVDPDGSGPLPKMPSQHAYHYMQKPGSGDIPPQVKSALAYFQAMAKQSGLDPRNAVLLAFKPELVEQLKQTMDPQAKEVYDTMAMIVQKYFSEYAGKTGANDPMGIR